MLTRYSWLAGVARDAGRTRWRARDFQVVMKTSQPDELQLSEESYSCQKVAQESSRAAKAAAVTGPRRSNSEAKLLHRLHTLLLPSESSDLLLRCACSWYGCVLFMWWWVSLKLGADPRSRPCGRKAWPRNPAW